jgi:branched-chain amino acid transport system ATP-binding protein
MTMLEVSDLSAAYGQHPALNGVSLNIEPGEIVVILGANGAGKSTLLRAISGICEGKVSGHVTLDGTSLVGQSADQIVERGVALVPEGRGIFGDLTVKENLMLGAFAKRARDAERDNLDRVLELFPKLGERQGQIARTMSGGEQQMVAIGRAMMSAPKILMLDEPSLGLSPLLCKELFQNLSHVKSLGIGVLLVEQNAKQSLAISDRGYLLENTQITASQTATKLAGDPAVQAAYLGAGSKTSKRAVANPSPSTPTATAPFRSDRDATPRRTAEQQIGGSIDDLVNTATRTSAETPRQPAREIAQAANKLASDRISVVLKDIEAAAKAARTRRAPERRTSVKPTTTPSAPPAEGPPPVIEIYRKPRVEVYRRRPSGQFERN